MGRPLKVVVVGDGQPVALRVAADLDRCGFAPTCFLVADEGEFERCAGESDLVVAWHPTGSLPVERVLHLLGARSTVGGAVYLVTLAFKDHGHGFGDVRIVVNNENFSRFHHAPKIPATEW